MFKTMIRVLEGIAATAARAAKGLAVMEDAWEAKKPQVEEALIDLSLDIEDGIRTTAEAFRWTAANMAKGASWMANKALTLTGRTYRGVEAIARHALPIVRKIAVDASTGLYVRLRAIHGYLGPVRRDLESRVYHAWAFREELLEEARA